MKLQMYQRNLHIEYSANLQVRMKLSGIETGRVNQVAQVAKEGHDVCLLPQKMTSFLPGER